jgi:DNA-binding transcriptional LysR family regulator
VPDLDTALLRVLRAVLDTGSFTTAAAELGFTQSAVSKQMRTLESLVGAPLFVRGARGVQATPTGVLVADRGARVLEQLALLDRELFELHSPLAGHVVLGGFATAAVRLVPATIARVQRDHPGVALEFEEGSTPQQIRRLRSGRLDLALLAVGEGLPDYDLQGVAREDLPSGPLLVAVPERHRFAARGTVGVDELAEESWIGGRTPRGDPHFGAWPSLAAPRVVTEIGDWSMRLGFVAAGLGITTIPGLAVGALPQGVVAVRVDDPGWRGRRLLLAWIGELSPAARVVRAAVRAEAAVLSAEAGGVRDGAAGPRTADRPVIAPVPGREDPA